MPYAIPNLRVEAHHPDVGVSVRWWRSVGHTHTAFATEVFFDELAAAAGKDRSSCDVRCSKDHPRHLGVLELAAEKAGWGTPLPAGRGRGVAVHESFGSFVAEVAEVTVRDDGGFSVDRVVCAVDCGIAVNPDVVRAQMEGGIGYGSERGASQQITLAGGAVQAIELHRLPAAADRRHAERRGAHRAVDGAAERRRRARAAAARACGRQRDSRSDRQTDPSAADRRTRAGLSDVGLRPVSKAR